MLIFAPKVEYIFIYFSMMWNMKCCIFLSISAFSLLMQKGVIISDLYTWIVCLHIIVYLMLISIVLK
jgi:hypothetical protein